MGFVSSLVICSTGACSVMVVDIVVVVCIDIFIFQLSMFDCDLDSIATLNALLNLGNYKYKYSFIST